MLFYKAHVVNSAFQMKCRGSMNTKILEKTNRYKDMSAWGKYLFKKKTLRKIENVCLVVKKPHEGETNERVCKKISENSCTLICFEVGLSELSCRNGAEKQPHCYSINVSADYGPKQLQLKIHLTFYLKELLKKVDSILERKIRNNTTLKNASPLSFWITRCIIFYYG